MLYSILYNNNLTPTDAVIRFVIMTTVFVFSLSLHEFAHAFSAYKMGDDTPKVTGRLSINPFKHISNTGFFMFLILGVGWAKPIVTNPLNYKKFKVGQRVVSIAGVLVNLLLGLISAVIVAILYASIGVSTITSNDGLSYLVLFFQYVMIINSFLALFNIIPIFPLDGFNFINTFFKKSNNKFARYNYKYGAITLYSIILICLLMEIVTQFDFLSYYLSLLYDYVFIPITHLGV